MPDFCTCDEWKNLKGNYPELFKWISPYGWIIEWKSLTDEKGYTQVHRYGIAISFCPMCGKKLINKEG
jgi:hypothetical protein